MSQKRFLAKLLWHSTFVISAVLSLILSVTVLAVATTTEIGQVGHFMVSLNGRQILFVSETSSASDHSWASVMLFDFSTSDVIGLTGKVIEVALSPDEKTIVCVEEDNYYGITLSLFTADGRRLKTHYYQKMGSFSQLRWSKNSKYLTFVYDGRPLFGKQTVVISPEKMGVMPDELANVEWQEPKKLQADHLLYQKKPTVRADSIVLWGDNKTIYVQAVDGIWQGSLDAGDPNLKSDLQSIHQKAEAHFQNAEYETALSIWQLIVDSFPESELSPQIYLRIGQCLYELKQYEQAREWFQKLVYKFPSLESLGKLVSDLRNYWAGSYFHERRYDQALETFIRFSVGGRMFLPQIRSNDYAKEFKPENVEEWSVDWGEAQAISGKWYEMLGRCYESEGEIPISKLPKSLEEARYYYPGRFPLPPMPKRRDVPSDVWKRFENLYTQIMEDVMQPEEIRHTAIYRLAEGLLEAGEYEKSRNLMRRIYDRTGFYKDSGFMIGRSYFEEWEYAKAVEWFNKDIRRYGHPLPIFFHYLGLSYYYLGEYDKALETFIKDINQRYPNVKLPIEIEYRIADSLYNLGKYQEAFDKYLELAKKYRLGRNNYQALPRIQELKEKLKAIEVNEDER